MSHGAASPPPAGGLEGCKLPQQDPEKFWFGLFFLPKNHARTAK